MTLDYDIEQWNFTSAHKQLVALNQHDPVIEALAAVFGDNVDMEGPMGTIIYHALQSRKLDKGPLLTYLHATLAAYKEHLERANENVDAHLSANNDRAANFAAGTREELKVVVRELQADIIANGGQL